MSQDILVSDHWPFSDVLPREVQQHAFDWMDKNKDVKYLIIQAPVGAGKSLIGMTFSRSERDPNGHSYILTPQKILQDQYARTFYDCDTITMYGKSNYTCPKYGNCEIGSQMGCSHRTDDTCEYHHTIDRVSGYSNAVTNYSMFLAHQIVEQSPFQLPRRTIVCDEAHTLEQSLTDFGLMPLTREMCITAGFKFVIPKSFEEVHALLKHTDLVNAIDNLMAQLIQSNKSIRDRKSPSKQDLQQLEQERKVTEMSIFLHTVKDAGINVYNDKNYVICSDANSWAIKPLFAKENFHLIANNCDRMLLMSATIVTPEKFCEDLGIDPSEMAYLSLKSEFPAHNRPVNYLPLMYMDASWANPNRAGDREFLLSGLETIINSHEDESGIIHTVNFKLSQFLVDELNSRGNIKHTIYHHNDNIIPREEAIRLYSDAAEAGNPSLLISPSITEGLDLIDDLGRFCIFAKVPFGYLGDQWIKRRQSISAEWYNRQAIISIIQGAGRIVRSPTDYGTTYIVDSCWKRLFDSSRHLLEDWWLDAYVDMSC